MTHCQISGQQISITEFEKATRQRLGFPQPSKLSRYIFQELSAFWPHFGIHKRQCDATGKNIISIYDEYCPYPVWYHEYWTNNANPPQANYHPDKNFFEQLWQLFQKCPIPHNIGHSNQNCDYTDDWWFSKDCYLSHSGTYCENCHYCYRLVGCKDCMYAVFSFNCQRCVDTINCQDCYNVRYALHCRNCRDSSFLFDCYNCSNCINCWNLRNKEFCIENKQLSQEEFQTISRQYQFSSRQFYLQMKTKFHKNIHEKAWWKALHIEKSENSTGNYLENCKNCHNCYLIQEMEDCINTFRGLEVKDCVDCISPFHGTEKVFYTVIPQDCCYDIRLSFNVINCQFVEYCSNCVNCQHCFGCCGLINGKYCIFNKPHSAEDYTLTVKKIKEQMDKEGVENKFFPGYFAPNPYEESLASVHWPLSIEQQEKCGFRIKKEKNDNPTDFLPVENIPDTPTQTTPTTKNSHTLNNMDLKHKAFWDPVAKRPFQILPYDLEFCQKTETPIPYNFYLSRLKENYHYLYCNYEMRETVCAKTGTKIFTSLPESLDDRILSREAYLAELY